jgi:hypothetical protein
LILSSRPAISCSAQKGNSYHFDALVAHLADGLEDAGQVLGRLAADRIELDADRDFLACAARLPGRCELAVAAPPSDEAGPGPD